MVAPLLQVFLQLNLLILGAFVLWRLAGVLARYCRLETDAQSRLRLARGLFGAALLAAPLYALLRAFLPEAAPLPLLAGELQVSAALTQGLDATLPLAGLRLSLAQVLLGVWALGLMLAALLLLRRWLQLRALLRDCLPWKRSGSIDLLLSDAVGGPFSTRALGRGHIVLPTRLLRAPADLLIALRHEGQHLRNGDLHWLLALELLKLPCFWNPVLAAWYREFDELQEFACDAALVGTRRLDRRRYGYCLLDAAAHRCSLSLPAASNMAPRFSLRGTAGSQLKRRIVMLERIGVFKHAGLKAWSQGLLLAGGLSAASLLVLAQEEEAPAVRRDYLPILTIQPQYPQRAVQDKVEGWLQVEFSVGHEGEVLDPQVIDSCLDGPGIRETDERGCVWGYDEAFQESVLAAVSRFRFTPRQEEGRAVETPGVQYVFRFNLAD